MLKVYICVGSSCHLKGSYFIIKSFQELIKKHNLEEKIEIKASFCLGNCTEGVSVKVDEQFIGGVTPENMERKFNQYILERF